MKKYLFLLIFVTAYVLLTGNLYSQEVYQVKAKYIGYEEGDYLHMGFKTEDGKDLCLWGNYDLLPVLKKNKKKWITVEYTIEEEYIPEARETMTIEILQAVIIKGKRYE